MKIHQESFSDKNLSLPQDGDSVLGVRHARDKLLKLASVFSLMGAVGCGGKVLDCDCPNNRTCGDAGSTGSAGSVSVEPGCESASDCACDSEAQAECREGVCYCQTEVVEQECSDMTRLGFICQLMDETVDMESYTPHANFQYTDLSSDNECYPEVMAAMDFGVLERDHQEGTALRVDDSLNRAEASKAVVFALQVPTTVDQVSPFPDVASSDWFYDYVMGLYQIGAVQGMNDGLFHPSETASTCFFDRAVQTAKNSRPQNSAVFTNLFGDYGINTSPAGTQDISTLHFNIATVYATYLRDISFYLYTMNGSTRPIPDTVEGISFHQNGVEVGHSSDFFNMDSAPLNTSAEIRVSLANALRMEPLTADNMFSVQIDLRPDAMPNDVMTALIPCNTDSFDNVTMYDENHRLVTANPTDPGCTVLNGMEVVVE